MRKYTLLFLFLIVPFLCSGCTKLTQVEDLAFAIIMGVDVNRQNEIEVCLQIPKITGKRSEEGSGGTSSELIYTAGGNSFDEALTLLEWAVPRRLDLSQIKLIVVSEKLAVDERFQQVVDTIMATPRLYTAARIAVCNGSAKEFVSAVKPIIGTRTSNELSATFEDYIRNGFIPDATFADFYYTSRSIYSDAMAIYAETVSKSDTFSAAPASAIIPSDMHSSNLQTQHSNRFLGAAIFNEGNLVGKLSGEEFLYCKILSGEQQTFPFVINGHTIGLTTLGTPAISIDMQSDPMQINISLRFTTASGSREIPINDLQTELTKAFEATLETCKKLEADPFGFAETAAGDFLTIDDWQAFHWHNKFSASTVNINVSIHSPDTQ